jgi:integrase
VVKPRRKRAATRRVHLTEKRVGALEGGPERVTLYDAKVTALGLKLNPNGSKIFFWFRAVDGKPKWVTIGPWPEITLESARAKAEEHNVALATWQKDLCRGPNPFERAKAGADAPTFGELVDAYVAGHVRATANHPEKAERGVRWLVRKHFADWAGRRIDTLAIEDTLAVRNALGKKNKKYMANRAVQFARAIFNWASGRRDGKVNFWPVAVNPAADVELYAEAKRTRFLQPPELVAFTDRLAEEPAGDFRDFLTLALSSGARRSDVLGMRWRDVSFERANWRVPFSKSGEAYDVALSPAAVRVLESRRRRAAADAEFVFPSFGRSGHLVDLKRRWERFRQRAGIRDVRVHDLRRTKGSYMAISGASLQQIGAALGHKSLESTEVYARLHDQAVREAAEGGDRKMDEMVAQARKRLKLSR